MRKREKGVGVEKHQVQVEKKYSAVTPDQEVSAQWSGIGMQTHTGVCNPVGEPLMAAPCKTGVHCLCARSTGSENSP